MFWVPTQQTQKAMARTKRLRRRRRIARGLLFLFVIFGLTAASAPSGYALREHLNAITAPHQFDFVNWESLAVTSELGRRIFPPSVPESEDAQRALVEEFLALEDHARQLKRELNQIYAEGDLLNESTSLEQELAQTKTAQAKLTPQIETILSRQTETILREEGFAVGNQVFPPVAFRLVDPPTNLIISPRDRIANQRSMGLQPGLENNIRFDIEDTIDQRGDVSAYVTDVGGLGSYPTMVVNHPHLIWLAEVVAHEWVHNYFLTFPTNLGWGYQTYPKLTTINETTADIIGEEIGRQVILRFYPEWADQLPPLDNNGQPTPAEPSEFHLTMRDIRLEVDRLLEVGQIEAAEGFMETERKKLVAKGHNLRKLNQAYFAFHGSYALSPTSVDPIGPQLRQLRETSPSLNAFAQRVGWLNSYNDYLNWLDEAGVNTQ